MAALLLRERRELTIYNGLMMTGLQTVFRYMMHDTARSLSGHCQTRFPCSGLRLLSNKQRTQHFLNDPPR